MKNRDKGMKPDTRPGVTFSAVLSLLQPYDHVFIERSISPHELEAVGGGTVEELRAIRCMETCGDCKVERLGLTVDEPKEDWVWQDTPVLVITIGEKEKEAEPWIPVKGAGQQSTRKTGGICLLNWNPCLSSRETALAAMSLMKGKSLPDAAPSCQNKIYFARLLLSSTGKTARKPDIFSVA